MNLLDSNDALPIVWGVRVPHPLRQISHAGRNAGTPRAEIRDGDVGESTVVRSGGSGVQGEEILNRVCETGEVPQRRDAACGVLVEQAGRHCGGAVLKDGDVGRI